MIQANPAKQEALSLRAKRGNLSVNPAVENPIVSALLESTANGVIQNIPFSVAAYFAEVL
jgi:hypothetical protein